MNAQYLLLQLLEEYGVTVRGTSCLDESVSEYVVQAMVEDHLDEREKEEFLVEVVVELACLDESSRGQFVKDLMRVSRQLQALCQQEETSEFPQLSSSVNLTKAKSEAKKESGVGGDVSCRSDSRGTKGVSGRGENKGKEKDRAASLVSKDMPRSNKAKEPKKENHNANKVVTSSERSVKSGTASHHPSPEDRTMNSMKRVFSKYIPSSDVSGIDMDIMSYIYEICVDPLNSLDDKREIIFAYFPEMRLKRDEDRPEVDDENGDDNREEEKNIIAKDIERVALHLNKLDLRKSKADVEQEHCTLSETITEEISGSIMNDTHTFSSEVHELHSLLPHLEPLLIQYVYEIKYFHNKEQTVAHLLEIGTVESEIAHLDNERKEHWKKQKELKKQQAMVSAAEVSKIKSSIFERYGETEMNHEEYVRSVSRSGNTDISAKGSGNSSGNGKNSKKKDSKAIQNRAIKTTDNERVRYRDGVVATYSGEKVITIKNPKDDYDGGSRGIVKTKGKRGPGFVRT